MKRFEKLRRRFRGSGKPRLMMGVHPIPTMVTLGNLLCGFGAIVLAVRSYLPQAAPPLDANACLYWAGILIFAAMFFDVMDGKVARWTKSTSKFGMEMDSLCDVVSFGVAPAILVLAMIGHPQPESAPYPIPYRYVLPMLGVYVCCAAIRLARYNVESTNVHRDFFFGMPSPGAAGCAASLAVLVIPGSHMRAYPAISPLKTLLGWELDLYAPMLIALPFVMLVLGVLMVTRVHYPHVGDRLLRGRKSFMHILILGLGLALFVMLHEIMLALAFNGYMLFGLLNELRYHFFPSQRPAEWVSASDELNPAPPPPPPDTGGQPSANKEV